jgi:hypothetical protein
LRVQGVVPRLGCGILSIWPLYLAQHSYRRIWPRQSSAGCSRARIARVLSARTRAAPRVPAPRLAQRGTDVLFPRSRDGDLPGLAAALQTPPLLLKAVPLFTHPAHRVGDCVLHYKEAGAARTPTGNRRAAHV